MKMSKEMISPIIVYFALAMEGINPKDVKAIFLKAVNSLETKGLKIANRHILESHSLKPKNSLEETNKVVNDDLKVLKECDILLVDYSIPNRNYVGATCEIVYAYLWEKPIIVYVGESDNDQRLWLRYHATHICNTLEQALRYLIENYTQVNRRTPS